MKKLKAKDEFKVGKHNIGWVSDFFKDNYGSESFEESAKMPTSQTLTKYMTDSEIQSELKPDECTLGDVLIFLENDTKEHRDGNWNIFYVGTFVVGVFWNSRGGGWFVGTWYRDSRVWLTVTRVFSPATDPKTLGTKPSDTLILPNELNINGIIYRKV